MASATRNIQSFVKNLGANESFDVPEVYLNGGMVIYNPNPLPIMIWAGQIGQEYADNVDLGLPVYQPFSGDIETAPDLDEAARNVLRAVVRTYGVPLPSGGIWEPFISPDKEVHIVYEDDTTSWSLRGML